MIKMNLSSMLCSLSTTASNKYESSSKKES